MLLVLDFSVDYSFLNCIRIKEQLLFLKPMWVTLQVLGGEAFSMLSEVVKKGYRWRIGNSSRVRVWKDNWIPGLACLNIRIPMHTLGPDGRFVSLLTGTYVVGITI